MVSRNFGRSYLVSGTCRYLPSLPLRRDLTDFSLEDLMNVQVTSVSKKEQKLSKTGAAIFVITQEDISHSGATNIPDLLRIVPGVDVARLDANQWAISIRGFNGVYGDKVLVLIDGRTVYLDTVSNVYWDQQDVPREDIDRIEVIRGPGGTVWGANAVNGVINIITKSAKDTPGGLVMAGSGSEESARGLLQYGGTIGMAGVYRAFAQYFNVNPSLAPSGQTAADGWHAAHVGLRSDWNLSPRDTLTVEGDLFRSGAGQTVTTVFANALPLMATVNDPISNTTGNILGRWNHTLRNGSDTSLQMYYDYNHRNALGQYDEIHHKVDLDFNHHIAFGPRNDVVWGLGYRFEADNMRPGYAVTFLPARSSRSLFSAFIQEEIKLTSSVSLTLGSKFEHNAFTGFEFEPSAQLVWNPSVQHTFWASAARAIRQPSLSEVGVQIDAAIVPLPGGALGVVTLSGKPQVKAEELRDYEVGYRSQVSSKRVSLDVAGFWSNYRHLISVEPATPFFAASPPPPHLVVPFTYANLAHARDYGVELFGTWDVTSRWKISPGYSLLQMSVKLDPPGQDASTEQAPGNSPPRQSQVRSWVKLRKDVDWDTTAMYVSRLSGLAIPSYVRLDSRLGWRIGESIEISVTGQNLLTPRHLEFIVSPGAILETQVSRSVFGKITWRF